MIISIHVDLRRLLASLFDGDRIVDVEGKEQGLGMSVDLDLNNSICSVACVRRFR
jgi:hypothetical protein